MVNKCGLFFTAHLNHPGTVGKSHYVPLFPEESRIRPFDHLKLVELFHGIDLARGLVSDLQRGWRTCWHWQTQITQIISPQGQGKQNSQNVTATRSSPAERGSEENL